MSAAAARLCALAELHEHEPLRVELDEIDIAVVRIGAEVFAIEDLCSHAEVPLSTGEVTSESTVCSIECELHGSRFDLRTGKPSGPPATRPVPVFKTSVINGEVFAQLEKV